MNKYLIGFDSYRIACIIGVYPEERMQEQEILVDLRVGHEGVKADEIASTLCYVELAQLCAEVACKEYQLLETFAAEVIQEIIARFGERSVWIRVRKPKGLPNAEATVVEATWDGP